MAICSHCGRDMNFIDGRMVCSSCGFSYDISKKLTYEELLKENQELNIKLHRWRNIATDILEWENEIIKDGHIRKELEGLLEE